MKLARVLAALVLCSELAGCAIRHNYVWQEYPIAQGRVLLPIAVPADPPVAVLKGKSDTNSIFLGNVGAHEYYGSEQALTDAIAQQLREELQTMRFTVSDSAGKTLEVRVNRCGFEQGVWKIAASLELTVTFGNGKSKPYTVRNSSPGTVDRAYNGAVALAVMSIINDPEVIAYIRG